MISCCSSQRDPLPTTKWCVVEQVTKHRKRSSLIACSYVWWFSDALVLSARITGEKVENIMYLTRWTRAVQMNILTTDRVSRDPFCFMSSWIVKKTAVPLKTGNILISHKLCVHPPEIWPRRCRLQNLTPSTVNPVFVSRAIHSIFTRFTVAIGSASRLVQRQ